MCYCGVLGCKIVVNFGMFCLVGITGECHIFAVEVLYSRIGIKYPPLQFSPAKESGNGPSLGCAVQEENGYSKGKNGSFLLEGALFFPGHFCPATEAKGKKCI